jgi:hypothetical protein
MLFSFSSNCLFFSLCVSQTLRNKSSPNAAYFPVKHTQFFLFFFLLNLLAFQVAISFYFGHDQVVKVSEKNPPKKTGQSKEELRRRRSAGEHVRAYSGLLEGQVTPGVYSVSQSRGDPVIAIGGKRMVRMRSPERFSTRCLLGPLVPDNPVIAWLESGRSGCAI